MFYTACANLNMCFVKITGLKRDNLLLVFVWNVLCKQIFKKSLFDLSKMLFISISIYVVKYDSNIL